MGLARAAAVPDGVVRGRRRRAAFWGSLLLATVAVVGWLGVAWTRSMEMLPYAICGGISNRPSPAVHVGDRMRCERFVNYRASYTEVREVSGLVRFVRLETSDPRVLRTDGDTAIVMVAPGHASYFPRLGWIKGGSRAFSVEPAVARARIVVADTVVEVGDTVHVTVQALAADGSVLTSVQARLSYLTGTGLLLGAPVHPVVPTQPGPMTVVGIAGPARDSVVLDVRPKRSRR